MKNLALQLFQLLKISNARSTCAEWLRLLDHEALEAIVGVSLVFLFFFLAKLFFSNSIIERCLLPIMDKNGVVEVLCFQLGKRGDSFTLLLTLTLTLTSTPRSSKAPLPIPGAPGNNEQVVGVLVCSKLLTTHSVD